MLESLDLSQSQISNLRILANLDKLETLYLEGTSVSDLSPLIGLKSLRTIFLDPEFPKSEIEKLQTHNPHLEFR